MRAAEPGDTTFQWTARTASGERRKGLTAAPDKKTVAEVLRIEGLYPVGIEAVTSEGKARKDRPKKRVATKAPATATPSKGSVRAVSMVEADLLIGRLAKLVGMGITLDRALGFIEEAPGAKGASARVAQTAQRLRKATREGAQLSDALRDHAGWEDAASLTLIRAAEVSGDLAQALAAVKTILETRLALVRRLATGLIYPAILILVAILSVGLVLVAIIPEFRPIVDGRYELIPWLGRAVFALSAWLETVWMLLLPLLGLLAVGAVVLHRRGRLMPLLTKLALRLPFTRGLILRTGMIRSLHVLGTLLSRGVVVSDAMRTLADNAGSGPLEAAFETVSQRIEGGDPLWQALSDTGLAPPDAIEMIRIGEEAGDLPGMILRSADDLRASADRDLERAMLLFQPALIVFVGLLIGVSLYALFSAISAVNSISF